MLCRGPGVAGVLLDGRLGALAVRVEHRGVVDLVAELHEDGEDLVGLLPAELDVLALAELDDLGAASGGHLLVPGQHLLQRGLTLCVLLLAEGAFQVVLVRLDRRGVAPVDAGGAGCRRPVIRLRGGEGGCRRGGGGQGHGYRGGAQRSSLSGHLMQSSPAFASAAWSESEPRAINASQVTTFDRSYERKDRS